MKTEDKALFCTLLTGTAELYKQTLTPSVLEIYWTVLEKYPVERIKQALNLHVRNPDNGQFMPKPADILRYIELSSMAKAMYAWDKVDAARARVGGHNSIIFDDLLIHVVINEMRGWVSICHQETKNHFVSQEFQRRYMTYLFYPPPPAPPHLIGRYEQQNRLNGFDKNIPQPVFFGDREMKLLISNLTSDELQKLENSNGN